MLDHSQIERVIGHQVLDANGDSIGKIGNIYVDDQTNELSFATVKTGFFGTNESFVPLRDASLQGDDLQVPYSKDQVKDAPNIADDGHISPEEEQRIFEHYQLDYGTGGHEGYDTEREGYDTERSSFGEGYDASGPTTDEAMTRAEERVQMGTASSQETGRARLSKYVVTEQENVTVPVRKEKAVLESEPITNANVGEAMSGPEISEEEHEVVLHEERPVVETVAEPVERVRLGTEEVVDEENVTVDVRKERIEAEGNIDRR